MNNLDNLSNRIILIGMTLIEWQVSQVILTNLLCRDESDRLYFKVGSRRILAVCECFVSV